MADGSMSSRLLALTVTSTPWSHRDRESDDMILTSESNTHYIWKIQPRRYKVVRTNQNVLVSRESLFCRSKLSSSPHYITFVSQSTHTYTPNLHSLQLFNVWVFWSKNTHSPGWTGVNTLLYIMYTHTYTLTHSWVRGLSFIWETHFKKRGH